jgi:hypothetical protein
MAGVASQSAVGSSLYSLWVDPDGLARVRLETPPGHPLADLLLLSSAHTSGAVDELIEVAPVEVRALESGLVEISQSARSSVWEQKRAVLRSYPDRLEYWCELRGKGALEEVTFFEVGDNAAGDSVITDSFRRAPRAGENWRGSLAYFSNVFNPTPNCAFRQYGLPGERASIHPSNEGAWGGDRFFTPAPFVFGLGDPSEARWAMVGLGCSADEASFSVFDYRGGPIWGLGLSYEGYTRVDGFWRTPRVVILPVKDEYHGLSAYTTWLRESGYCSQIAPVAEPWWREPIWCGWGEQVAREGPQPARELSTQANYESWLSLLAAWGLVPGTICVDDRWMARMGHPEPHPERWSGLASFIASRQAAGQRVLLWHNAWELEGEGVEPDELIAYFGQPALGAFGSPLMDPTSPRVQDRLRRLMVGLLAPPPHGLGADGLKVDITFSTPVGPGYRLQSPHGVWGNALLHQLLRLTYRLAKEVKPSALVEGHAANPLFRDTADVLRLNDLHTNLTSVVEMMRHRARVARSAGFDLIDTDGWPIPSRAALLEYVSAQPKLGIPALYYATRLDVSGETLTDSDYRHIAKVWERYRGRSVIRQHTA